jgi:hypothetical protein
VCLLIVETVSALPVNRRSLIGDVVRREQAGGIRQGVEAGLHQQASVSERRRMVRGNIRGRPVGSGRGSPLYARQVLDTVSA